MPSKTQVTLREAEAVSWLADAMQLIQDTAIEARCRRVITTECEPDGWYYLDAGDGKLELIRGKTPPPVVQLYTLEAFVGVVDVLAGGVQPKPIVLAGRGQVLALFRDDDHRDDRVFMHLPHTAQYEAIAGLAHSPRTMAQGELIAFLTRQVTGTVEPAAIDAFRQLSFAAYRDADGEFMATSDTVSKKVHNEVLTKNGGKVPDTVTFQVRVYRDLEGDDLEQQIEAAVVVDAAAASIGLIPLAGELEAAERATDDWLCQQLADQLTAVELVAAGSNRESTH